MAKSFTLKCGATLSEGTGNSGFDRISRGQKFQNFRPYEILLCPLFRVVVQLSVKGPEFLAKISTRKFPRAGISALSGPQKFHPRARISGVSELQREDFEL
jgi:hypothetical protein